jgi:CBS domain-containing protein
VRDARIDRLNKGGTEDKKMFSIDAIMSTNLVTVEPSATLAEARTLMHDNRIHHIPVVEGDQLVGLVTLTNVLAATDSFLRDDNSRIHANEIGISDMMVTDVATVDVNASLRHAALFLERHKIGCLPVLDDGKLVGIITDTDFVGVAINLLEQIEETEPVGEDFDDLDVA